MDHNERTGQELVEVTPVSIHLPMRAVLDESSSSTRWVKRLKASGYESPTTTLEECDRNRAEISAEFQKRYIAHDVDAVPELLRINAAFIAETWVQEAAVDLLVKGYPKRAMGRRRGHLEETIAMRLMIVVYIDWLRDKYRRENKRCSVDYICHELGARSFETLSKDHIKKIYYETRNDSRMRPLLFRRHDLRAVMPASHVDKYCDNLFGSISEPERNG